MRIKAVVFVFLIATMSLAASEYRENHDLMQIFQMIINDADFHALKKYEQYKILESMYSLVEKHNQKYRINTVKPKSHVVKKL